MSQQRIKETINQAPDRLRVRKGDLVISKENIHTDWLSQPGELVIEGFRVLNSRSRNGFDFSGIVEKIAECHRDGHPCSNEHERQGDLPRRFDDRLGSWHDGRVVEGKEGTKSVNANLHINEFTDHAKRIVRDAVSNPKNLMASIEISAGGWTGSTVEESDGTSITAVSDFETSALRDTAIVAQGGNTNSIAESLNTEKEEGLNMSSTIDNSGSEPNISSVAQLMAAYPALTEQLRQATIKECDCANKPVQADLVTMRRRVEELEQQLNVANDELSKAQSAMQERERADFIQAEAKKRGLEVSEKQIQRWKKLEQHEVLEEIIERADSKPAEKDSAKNDESVSESLKASGASAPKVAPKAPTGDDSFIPTWNNTWSV